MDSDLRLARDAALAGAAIGLDYFAALTRLARERKPDGSVVTEADRAVETAIRTVLADARPDDAVLGEEAGQTGRGSRRWIVDPIDGTALFVAGDDRWLVLVALEEAGEITVGVAVVPAQGRIWWASRGGGAYTARVAGATVTGARRITVATDRPDTLPGGRLGVIPTGDGLYDTERAMLRPLTRLAPPRHWPAHAALLVAGGEFDLAVQARGQLWDYAATSLIVAEAVEPAVPAAGAALFARSAALHEAALRLLRGDPTPA